MNDGRKPLMVIKYVFYRMRARRPYHIADRDVFRGDGYRSVFRFLPCDWKPGDRLVITEHGETWETQYRVGIANQRPTLELLKHSDDVTKR